MINSSYKAEWVYTFAVIFFIIWAVGFFVYSAGYIIHVLLLAAIIAVILGLMRMRDE